jgi:hypothetical protein
MEKQNPAEKLLETVKINMKNRKEIYPGEHEIICHSIQEFADFLNKLNNLQPLTKMDCRPIDENIWKP